MRTALSGTARERGSALLASLVLVFVLALLGMALFDLGTYEHRLVDVTQVEARAFEIAQAGVERALGKLQDTFNNDASNPHTWAVGSALCSGGTHRGCSDRQFYPAAGSYISDLGFDIGTYAVEFRQVTAETLSVPCRTDSDVVSDVDAAKKICDDLIFVRATGQVADAVPGYTATRTIQLLAQMTQIPGACLICRGLVGGTGTGAPINGNVKIAGSIQVLGVEGSPSLSFGGSAGQTNSYADLDSTTLARIPRLPLVCPIGTVCSGGSGLVESLGATLKIPRPTDVAAVTLSGAAKLGESGTRTYAGDATRKGKGPLDGIFVADGCNMPCTDSFRGGRLNSNIFVDDNNMTKPYRGVLPSFPLFTAAWQVAGVRYARLACPGGSSCTPPATPDTSEFFVSRAAKVMLGGNCVPDCAPLMNSLGSTTGLTGATPPFSVTIVFYDRSSQLMKAQICWRRSLSGLPANTLEFGQAIPYGSATPTCDIPAPSSAPLLVYFPSSTPASTGFNIQRSGGPTEYNYRGSAIVVTNGLVQIEETLQTCQTTAAGSPCLNHGFPADSSLTVMTWGGNSGVCAGSARCGNMNLGDSTANIDRIMGFFYSGCDPADAACSGSGATKGILRSRKQTNIVGSVMAYRLCFAGGSSPCPSGGNVPSFFEVDPDTDNLIEAMAPPFRTTFTIGSVSRYWVECKRTPGDTLPAGLCSYTP